MPSNSLLQDVPAATMSRHRLATAAQGRVVSPNAGSASMLPTRSLYQQALSASASQERSRAADRNPINHCTSINAENFVNNESVISFPNNNDNDENNWQYNNVYNDLNVEMNSTVENEQLNEVY